MKFSSFFFIALTFSLAKFSHGACDVIDTNAVVGYHPKGPKILVKTTWTKEDPEPFVKYIKILNLAKNSIDEVIDFEKISGGNKDSIEKKYEEVDINLKKQGYKFRELIPLEQKTTDERVGAIVPALNMEVFTTLRVFDATKADVDLLAIDSKYKQIPLKKGIARVPLSSPDATRLGTLYSVARDTFLLGLYDNCSEHFWSLSIQEAKKKIKAAQKAKPVLAPLSTPLPNKALTK